MTDRDPDALHVATLDILNLADRWPERLPLLLVDMAALQPDVLGLQEVVYLMQQDRLIGAAGAGVYAAVRGWAGRPEYGNGREPAVTWPSGLIAPAMDTEGPPGWLDHIWVRGAIRVAAARLAFDRPQPDDPTLYPSDDLGIAARLEVG